MPMDCFCQHGARAHWGPRHQSDQAAGQVTAFGAPALGQRVAAGQDQSRNHTDGANDHHRAERLPGQGDGEKGRKGRLARDEQEGPGGSHEGDGHHPEGVAPDELRNTHRHDPGQDRLRNLAYVARGEDQDRNHRNRDRGRHGADDDGHGMRPLHRGAGRHRDTATPASPMAPSRAMAIIQTGLGPPSLSPRERT